MGVNSTPAAPAPRARGGSARYPGARGGTLVGAGLVLLLAGAALAGCGVAPGRIVPRVPPGTWAATLGSGTRAAFAAETAPETPEEQWRQGMERGLQSTPVLHDDLLLIPSTARALIAASAESGKRYWIRRLNGPVVGPALRHGDRVFVATASRDGRVYAFDVQRGRRRWQTRLRGPVSADPLLVGERLVVSTVRGQLSALATGNGDVLWQQRLPGPQLGAAVADGDVVVLATARDTLLRVDTRDGRILSRVALPGTPTASLARSAANLLVPAHPDRLLHYRLADLALLRVDTLGAPVLAAPVVDADGTAWVLTASGDVWRIPPALATNPVAAGNPPVGLDPAPVAAGAAPAPGAMPAVRLAALGGTARESLTLARNGLLVGRLDGTLFLLRRDGSEVWRRQFDSSLRAPVALGSGALFVTLLDGRIVKLQ